MVITVAKAVKCGLEHTTVSVGNVLASAFGKGTEASEATKTWSLKCLEMTKITTAVTQIIRAVLKIAGKYVYGWDIMDIDSQLSEGACDSCLPLSSKWSNIVLRSVGLPMGFE